MFVITDIFDREIRVSEERFVHIMSDHLEMRSQEQNIKQTLLEPDTIIKSISDEKVELYYRHYPKTPVTSKYLCVVVKTGIEDRFMITAYFTDKVKKGELIWRSK